MLSKYIQTNSNSFLCKKTVNASTMFNTLFESEEVEEHHVDDSGLDEGVLDNLENQLGE